MSIRFNWTPSRVEQALHYHKLGKGYQQIADKMGTTKPSVASMFQYRFGTPSTAVTANASCLPEQSIAQAQRASKALHRALWREHPKIMRNLGAVRPEDSRAL